MDTLNELRNTTMKKDTFYFYSQTAAKPHSMLFTIIDLLPPFESRLAVSADLSMLCNWDSYNRTRTWTDMGLRENCTYTHTVNQTKFAIGCLALFVSAV